MSAAPIGRRGLLRAALLCGAAGLGGCAVTRTGGTTTATLDVARVVADGRAIVSALGAALALPGVAALLGANLALADAALAAAGVAMTGIEQIAGGTVTVSIDTAKLQGLVLSLLGDAQTVLSLLQRALAAAGQASQKMATLSEAVAAVLVLVPLVQHAAGLSGAPPAAGGMDEAEALRIVAGLRS